MPITQSQWYDDYYKGSELAMGPWHRFLLPELATIVHKDTRILEFGCGQGQVLRWLVQKGYAQEKNIVAVEQSESAASYVRQYLPSANIHTGDLYNYSEPKQSVDICLLLETIEHLERPQVALENVKKILKEGGRLYISFPNFLHLPWLAVRLLSEWLNRPSWIVLQPVDKIYTVFGVIKLLRNAGFRFEKGIGSNYAPPVIYPLEREWMTRMLNHLKLWWISFHPILLFVKPNNSP